MKNPLLKKEAVRYRRKGYSYNEISKRLAIPKSTLSGWLNGLDLSAIAVKRLDERKSKSWDKLIVGNALRRKKQQIEIISEVEADLLAISKNERFYRILAAMLFWGEGSKTRLNSLRITNSDPDMIKAFLFLLRSGFKIDENKFRVKMQLHAYHVENKQKAYWSDVTMIPFSNFTRSYIKVNGGKIIHKEYPGCIAITYFDARIAKKLWSYCQNINSVLGV